ncbi:MAG: hypothetical protein SFV81_04935, partial [Pirellulaceae bacterium]|nr:hypothetical protein [Pirellulaceae bacterium]
MRKFYGALALTMAFCLVSASVFAQDERPARGGRGGGGGGPGGGGPGGFGRGMGMGMMQQGGASQLLGLLRMEEVRKEVKVSDESYEAVQTAQREAMGAFREASEEERTKLMKDLNVKAQEYLDELVDPAGMKRLMGLLLQQQGQSAATNELIAKEIGLKDPELKAVNEVVAKMNEERGTKMREMFTGGGFGGGGGGGGPDPEMQKKMTDLMADLRKKTDTAVDEKLTADQKKAIEALKGEKFTFPEFGGFGGRGGPG